MEKTVAYIFGNYENPAVYGTVHFTGRKKETVRIIAEFHGLGDDLWGWAICHETLPVPYYLPVLVPDGGDCKIELRTDSFTALDTVGKKLILAKGTWLYHADRPAQTAYDLTATIKLVLKGNCFYNER